MEEKINVAEILKDKAEGTKLYSPICGECKLSYVESAKSEPQISTESDAFGVFYFWDDGKAYNEGECLLFPSSEMRDWSKFAWKKGDVLVNSRGLKILFDRWANYNYTSFYAKTINLVEDGFLDTNLHTLASEKEAKSFIKCIEEKLGGKLNCETLEVEKAQLEFKDGDIVHDVHGYNTYIIKEFSNKHIKIYAGLTKQYGALLHKIGISEIFHLRLATEEEKQQLFSALAKEGKAWDAEKKQIVDLKPKCEFKPMDLCLMKYIGRYNNRGWELCQYAYTEHRVSSSGEQRDFYHSVGGEIYAECIPYNEDTKHLLGTRDKWKGGEQ